MVSEGAAALVIAIIGIVIFVAVLTSLGPTVVTNTDTSANSALENASSTSKTMYSLIELLYPIIGVIVMVSIGFAVGRKF
jgi:hypothetical protein